MLMNFIPITKIYLAHECVIDEEHRCEYLDGRGQYGLVYAINGEAEYRFTDGKRCIIKSGEIMLISPRAAYAVSVKSGFRHYTVNFEVGGELPELSDGCYRVFTAENPEQYRQIFKRAASAYKRGALGHEYDIAASICDIFSLIYSELSVRRCAELDIIRLEPARKYIDAHFRESTPLDALARLCNMSVTSLRREWKRIYGDTPLKYRDGIRISYAKERLAATRLSVGEIAELSGFEDVSYFVRFFKKHVGLSPSGFRKKSVIM